MVVRKMTAADIDAAISIDVQSFAKPWSAAGFAEEIAKDYSHYFVAECDGETVGYCGIWCIYETAELVRIAVLPKYRRRGLADGLLAKASEQAKASGCERMMLEVRRTNDNARRLYEKHGFNEISVRKGYYDGEDAIIMEVAYE